MDKADPWLLWDDLTESSDSPCTAPGPSTNEFMAVVFSIFSSGTAEDFPWAFDFVVQDGGWW